MVTAPGPRSKQSVYSQNSGARGDGGSSPLSVSKIDNVLSKNVKIMKRKSVEITLLGARTATTNEDRMAILLVGIHELLYAIAEELGVFEDEDEIVH